MHIQVQDFGDCNFPGINGGTSEVTHLYHGSKAMWQAQYNTLSPISLEIRGVKTILNWRFLAGSTTLQVCLRLGLSIHTVWQCLKQGLSQQNVFMSLKALNIWTCPHQLQLFFVIRKSLWGPSTVSTSISHVHPCSPVYICSGNLA